MSQHDLNEIDEDPADRIIGSPDRVWLCYGDIGLCGDVKHDECDEVTWCSEPQESSDVEYVRADVNAAAIAASQRENEQLRARLSEAEKLVRMCRDEMGRLPHSLGYAFTHLPKIDAFLNPTAAEKAHE